MLQSYIFILQSDLKIGREKERAGVSLTTCRWAETKTEQIQEGKMKNVSRCYRYKRPKRGKKARSKLVFSFQPDEPHVQLADRAELINLPQIDRKCETFLFFCPMIKSITCCFVLTYYCLANIRMCNKHIKGFLRHCGSYSTKTTFTQCFWK